MGSIYMLCQRKYHNISMVKVCGSVHRKYQMVWGGVQGVYRVYSILNKNALICAFSVLCKEAGGQHVDAESEKVLKYHHDQSVWKCPQKVTNGVMRSLGGV